jgi:hypothetical protein
MGSGNLMIDLDESLYETVGLHIRQVAQRFSQLMGWKKH